MYRILVYIGAALLLLGASAFGFSLWEGPTAWHTDARTFWGIPISLFVLWIGLAHAGTLISAIFLVLGYPLGRRTSMIAELSTLCSLVVAALFPLVHLGVIENFYMVVPFLDARGNFANLRSPLVWDFCCIAVYGVVSLLFFVNHLFSEKKPALKKLIRPMAWLLFPLVLWVHTIVSLDFAVTFVPEWRGAFFPLYFIAGAIYSGLALVIILLTAEHCRVRILEKLMHSLSWFMAAFWLWEFLLKGMFSFEVVFLGAVVPQLMWLRVIRENTFGRLLVAFSVLISLGLERYILVTPSEYDVANAFGWLDLGLVAFSMGLFVLLFFVLRAKLGALLEGDDVVMGEIVLQEEESAKTDMPEYNAFPALRLPLLLGILVTLVYITWAVSYDNGVLFPLSVANIVPLCLPLLVFVASVVLCASPLWSISGKRTKIVGIILAGILGAFAGAFWAGGSSDKPSGAVSVQEFASAKSIGGIWASRCASCHGNDGKFNEKFVREFYPLPQKLSLERLDSLGVDSLVSVILDGRVNMNPYRGRVTEDEARGLVHYMRLLAGEEQ
ncbi:MAG: c-type cytochrome [Fibrobacter sp.]|nr:c-type cytochrome [Fibrobacter sp.]